MAASRDDETDARAPRPDRDAAAGRAWAGAHRTRRRREADEWALVLEAEGFAPSVGRTEGGFGVSVPAARAEPAAAILEAWRAERRARAARPPLPPPPETTGLDLAAAYATALLLLAYHVGVVLSGRHETLVALGDSQAVLVLRGELWRTITALTLHADAAHVAGNTLFGGFFLAALSGRLGLGCASLAFVVTGALGNLANAVYYGSGHSSIGASTGVFGLVGVLAGLAAWRRHQLHAPNRGAWVAFAAGLAVVGMLGGPGPRVDFSAHLFGLVAGALSGVALALPLARRPRPARPAQIAAALTTLILVGGAWRFA